MDSFIRIKILTLLALLLLSTRLLGEEAKPKFGSKREWRLLEVDKASIGWFKIANYNNPLIMDVPKKDWGDHVQMEMSLKAFRYGFMESNVYYDSALRKVSVVGLQFFTGVHAGKYLDIGWMHHSSHTADRSNSFGLESKYLLFDAYGAKLNFIK